MKILLPVDGSEASLKAVDYVIDYIQSFHSPVSLDVLHVHSPIPLASVVSHVGEQTLLAYYREEGEKQLAPACDRLTAARCTFQRHLHVGLPAEIIVDMAKQWKSDQIVMGYHGYGALRGTVLGSVTSQVLHHVTCPVLLVR